MCTLRSFPCLAILGCAVTLGGALGCADSEYAIEGSGDVEQVVGEVEIADHPSGDKLVTLSLSDLPPVDAHGASYGAYVVWLRPMGMETLKAGRLHYDARARLGMLEMRTPYESFELYVTAEREPERATQPGQLLVTRRVVQRAW